MIMNLLSGKKTYLTVLALFAVLFGKWQNWWTVPDEVYVALMGAALMFLRAGLTAPAGQQPAAPPADRPEGGQLVPIKPPTFLILALAIPLLAGCSALSPSEPGSAGLLIQEHVVSTNTAGQLVTNSVAVVNPAWQTAIVKAGEAAAAAPHPYGAAGAAGAAGALLALGAAAMYQNRKKAHAAP